MEQTKYDVFISYSRKDYVKDDQVIPGNPITAIQEMFDKEGISYWFDKDGIYSGEEFVKEISNAIVNSKMLVFVSSGNSNASEYTCGEILKAKKAKKLIIPFIIDACDYNEKFEILLLPLNHIDFVAQPNTALPELLRTVRKEKERIAKEEADASKLRKIVAAQNEIKDKAKEYLSLVGQQDYILRELYEKNGIIGVTTKRCPVCEKDMSIQSLFCDRCGWLFPKLYGIDVNDVPLHDEAHLSLARTNWQGLDSLVSLQDEVKRLKDGKNSLEQEKTELERQYKALEQKQKEAEERIREEEKRSFEENKRKEEEAQRKAEEAKRQEMEIRVLKKGMDTLEQEKAELERQYKALEKKQKEAEERIWEEEKRKTEEKKQKEDEARRKAEEAKRQEMEIRDLKKGMDTLEQEKAELERQYEALEKKQKEAEERFREEEKRRVEENKRKEEEARRKSEEAKRQEEEIRNLKKGLNTLEQEKTELERQYKALEKKQKEAEERIREEEKQRVEENKGKDEEARRKAVEVKRQEMEQTKYDIFISYSRNDLQIVKGIKEAIERSTGARCWMDLDGIESGESFHKKIISAINFCDMVLFIMSEHSMRSDWALNELKFAWMKRKRLVLVAIENVEMTDEFYFCYHKYYQIEWNNQPQREQLLRDIKRWTGKTAVEEGEEIKHQELERERFFTANGVSFKMIRVEGNGAPYYIGETQVTQELWEAVMKNNPSAFKGKKRPVECVSWNDCKDFIRELNAITKHTFRLPTEAEWEYAARGGNKSQGYEYAGSDNIDEVAWYNDNSGEETHDVKTKKPNELGIYDMSGNVWEWCEDLYDASASLRVHRGGSWYYDARLCRVSSRSCDAPVYRSRSLGLRLAL